MSLVDVNLKEKLNKEVENWDEGGKRVFWFPYYDLGFNEQPTEEELEQVGTGLSYIEDIQLGEDGEIIVTVSEKYLHEMSESQLRDWIDESDLRQFGRYESCGWV